VEVVPGRELWCEDLGVPVRVDAVDPGRRKAWVHAGPVRMEVGWERLRELDPSERSSEPARPAGAPTPAVETPSVPDALDLRGLDRVEGLRRLDHYLDRALLQGLHRVRIIHGVGTGVLLEEVRRFLREQPHVVSFRPGEAGEGGAGVTIAFLGEGGEPAS
jgi:DNA mismatch repair protein MutS2